MGNSCTGAVHGETRAAMCAGEQGSCLDINCRGWPGHPRRAEDTKQDLVDLCAFCLVAGGWVQYARHSRGHLHVKTCIFLERKTP